MYLGRGWNGKQCQANREPPRSQYGDCADSQSSNA